MTDLQPGGSGAGSRGSRGANRHNIVDGRYPGADLYDVLKARCKRLEAALEMAREDGRTLAAYVYSITNPGAIPETVKAAMRRFEG